jgi:pyridoxine 4-dehydrogenase
VGKWRYSVPIPTPASRAMPSSGTAPCRSRPRGTAPLRPAQRADELRASVEDNLRNLGFEQVPVVSLRRLDTGPGRRASGDQVVDIDDQLAVMIAMRDEARSAPSGWAA